MFVTKELCFERVIFFVKINKQYIIQFNTSDD